MAVFRVEKNSGYTVMSNHHLRNRALSLKAKGLLSYNKIVVFIDRSPAECYNSFRVLWIGGTSPTAKTVFGRLQPQLLC